MQRAKTLRLFSFIGLTGLLALVIGSSFSTSSADNSTLTATTTIVDSNDAGLAFTLNLPAVNLTAEGVATVDGLQGRFSEAGTPDLPYFSALIALPPEADATVAVELSGEVAQSVAQIRPIASVNVDASTDLQSVSSLESLGLVYTEDETIYGKDAAFPSASYEISEPMYMRDIRVVRLKVFPISYNPVSQSLSSFSEISVNLSFSGAARSANNPLPGEADVSNILNGEAAQNWRSLPVDFNGRATNFPIGKETYKIVVDDDGIYELTYAALLSAGMNVASVNPNTFEMMHQGEPVAYEFVGDGDNNFESDEKIRFYGWAFDDSRHDRLFVADNNVFWLWADGSPTRISAQSNQTGTVVSEWTSTVNFEEEKLYFTGSANNFGQDGAKKWDNADNEAEAWHWFGLRNGVTETVTLELPDPVPSTTGEVLVELTNTQDLDNHNVDLSVNGSLANSLNWDGNENRNLSQTNIPINASNTIDLYSHHRDLTGALDNDDVLVNRITITYGRELKAVDNSLEFNYDANGAHRFPVAGFAASAIDNGLVAWDISNRKEPQAIILSSSDITDEAGGKTVAFGVSDASDGNYIVSADFTAVSSANISSYTAPSLEPSNNTAQWVAIAHADFIAETNNLAAHRATTSGLSTHTVNVTDVYNQYGYGLAIPRAIQDFLTHGLTWGMQYATLVGDATQNPLQRPCVVETLLAYTGCISTWTTSEIDYVLTDFQFQDRFIGLIASDHTFATLTGADEIEDIAIGRIAVSSVAELQEFNNKVVLFENALKNNAPYVRNIAWLADDLDQGGDFCSHNATVRNNFFDPNSTELGIEHKEICLKDYFPPGEVDDNDTVAPPIAKDNARIDFFNYMNAESARIINYRGHGSANNWAANFIRTSHAGQWLNLNRPSVILSADCLDGNFFRSGEEALGETFMQLDGGRGTVGHWSSSGLGFTSEHTVLHRGFYNGLYIQNLTTIGDAVRYAKNNYLDEGQPVTEVYSFILLGDPAMNMLPFSDNDGKPFKLYLPKLEK